MNNIKYELQEIVYKIILGYHRDLSQSRILIKYGHDRLYIYVNELLNKLEEAEYLSLERFLTICHDYDHVSFLDLNLIGEINIIDSINNEFGKFKVRLQPDKGLEIEDELYKNLILLDGGMPELLENIVRIVGSIGNRRCCEIVENLELLNPLDFDSKWIENVYKFKIGRLLYCFLAGMTENVLWNGRTPNGGVIVLNANVCRGFSYYAQNSIATFLINFSEVVLQNSCCRFRLLL